MVEKLSSLYATILFGNPRLFIICSEMKETMNYGLFEVVTGYHLKIKSAS